MSDNSELKESDIEPYASLEVWSARKIIEQFPKVKDDEELKVACINAVEALFFFAYDIQVSSLEYDGKCVDGKVPMDIVYENTGMTPEEFDLWINSGYEDINDYCEAWKLNKDRIGG